MPLTSPIPFLNNPSWSSGPSCDHQICHLQVAFPLGLFLPHGIILFCRIIRLGESDIVLGVKAKRMIDVEMAHVS
jgi:hypothetical protein